MTERHYIEKDLGVGTGTGTDPEPWLKDADEDVRSGCERRLEIEAKMDELDANE